MNIIIIYKYFINIYTLTENDLVTVLEATIKVTNWYHLGLKLDIPPHELERIKHDRCDEKNRLCGMLLYWLNTGGASWLSLVKALKSPLIDMKRLAMEIASNHSGVWLCVCVCLCACMRACVHVCLCKALEG